MANGFSSISGIAAPYLRSDVMIDYIAAPGVGMHDHGRTDAEPHDHPSPEDMDSSARRVSHAFDLERYLPDGSENPESIFNQAPYRNASILLAGRNFGIGGTHSPAAALLLGCGFRAVIAGGFGPVFHDDCIQSGLFPVILEGKYVQALAASTVAAPRLEMTVDLELQTIARPDSGPIPFQMNPRLLARFMHGLADEDETMPFRNEADAFREAQQLRQPWIYRTHGDPR